MSQIIKDMSAEIWERLQKHYKGDDYPVAHFINPSLITQVNAGNERYIEFMKSELGELCETLYAMASDHAANATVTAREEALEGDSEIARGVGVDDIQHITTIKT